jgi:hypothetical protein
MPEVGRVVSLLHCMGTYLDITGSFSSEQTGALRVEDACSGVLGVKVWGDFESNELEMLAESWESFETGISGRDESSGTEGRGTGTEAGGGEGARTRSASLIFGAIFRSFRARVFGPQSWFLFSHG